MGVVLSRVAITSQRGEIGASWWARRWNQGISEGAMANDLTNGRSYARKGRVMQVVVDVGEIRARVASSYYGGHYDIRVTLPTLPDAAWDHILDRLAGQARFSATLLAGELDPEVEAIFAEAGGDLFPSLSRDMRAQCTCYGYYGMPCRHMAAAHFVVAEALDDDPLLLFHMRGLPRAAVVEGLRERRAAAIAALPGGPPAPLAEPGPAPAARLANYDQPAGDLAAIVPSLDPPAGEAPALARLGDPPHLEAAALRKAYSVMSQGIRRRLAGAEGPSPGPPGPSRRSRRA